MWRTVETRAARALAVNRPGTGVCPVTFIPPARTLATASREQRSSFLRTALPHTERSKAHAHAKQHFLTRARPSCCCAPLLPALAHLADEIRRVFKLFDDDETGRISFRNLKRVARELGENMTDEELQEMINKADLDGDGEVNEDEFMRIMTCTLSHARKAR